MKIEHRPSPNYNSRPDKIQPDMVVIHYTGMRTSDEALARLTNPDAEVSAHYMITEVGTVLELVDPLERAWHAGVSHWQGRDNLNHYSIGIELVNLGHEFGYTEFPDRQIQSLLQLLAEISSRFNIKQHMYVGHSDIAPDRKEDPGEKFPWQLLAQHNYGIWSDLNGASEASLLDVAQPDAGDFLARIEKLQKNLKYIGYAIEVTGRYDDQTRACVRAFQRHWRQNSVTGEYDTGTDLIINDIIYQYQKTISS
jgi:N-acetylmuramoyl-L-alanine amidase